MPEPTLERPRSDVAPHLIAVVALVALTALAFSDVLGARHGLMYRDTASVFRPFWASAARALHEGHLPVLTAWSPGGVPMEQSWAGTVYTPLTLVLLAGPFDVTYDLFVWLHFVVLALGAYALAVRVGATAVEATLAASIAALSGPIVSLENLLGALQGLTWMPWAWLGWVGLLDSGRPAWAALLAVGAALHLEGPIPELLLLDAAAAALILWRARDRLDRARVALSAGAGIAALCLASVELGPVLEVLGSTRRGAGFDYAESAAWPLHPAQLAELVAPQFWRPLSLSYVNVPSITGGAEGPYLGSLYVGAALPFAAVALVPGPRRALRVGLCAALLLSLVVALGPATPLHRAVVSLPLLRSTRYPIKHVLSAALLLAALAPLTLRAALARRMAWAAALGAQLIVTLVLWRATTLEEWRTLVLENLPERTQYGAIHGLTADALAALGQQAMGLRALEGAAFALLGLIAVALRRPTVLAAVVALDLGVAARHAVVGVELEAARPSDALTAAVDTLDEWLFVSTPRGRRPDVVPREDESFLAAAIRSSMSRGELAFGDVRAWRDADPDGQSAPESAQAFRALRAGTREQSLRLLERLGVRGYSTWQPLGIAGEREVPIAGEAPQYVTRLAGTRPYVAAYPRWAPAPPLDAPEALLEALTSSAAWDRALLLAPRAGAPPASAAPPAPDCPLGATATVAGAAHVDGRVDATVEAACTTLVVARAVAMPGWIAEVDGREVPLYRAELGFVAAFVPAGQHRVRFEYRPLIARYLPIAGAGLALVLGALALELVRARRLTAAWPR